MLDAFSREAQEALHHFRSHWRDLDALSGRIEGQVAIVGLKGTGKKTLCNSLWGWQALADDLPDELIRQLGLFTLVTVPDNAYDESAVIYQLESAELVIYMVDGTVGIRPEDVLWIARLRALPAALLIAINKINLMPEVLAPTALAKMQDQFARPVIQLNAQDVNAVHEQLLPRMLKVCPALTVPLAAEITSLRWRVVSRLIRESALISGLVTLESGTTVDVAALIDLQRRLIQHIARVYGHADPNDNDHANVGTVAQRVILEILARVLARFGPFGRGLAASLIGASGTWTVGYGAQMRYAGAAPFARFNEIFHRNGNHVTPRDGR